MPDLSELRQDPCAGYPTRAPGEAARGAEGHHDVIVAFSRVLTLWDHRGLRAEAIHLPLVPRPSLDWRKEVHNLMISKEVSKSRKSTSSQ